MIKILLIFLLFNTIIFSQKKVLIVGNSLMFYNNMPFTLNNLFNVNSDSIQVEQLTHPGYTLRDHLDNFHYGNKSINFIQQHRYKNMGLNMEEMKHIYKYDCDIDTILKSSLEILIENTHYDYIIIQEHGQNIMHNQLLKYNASKSLERLINILKKNNSSDSKILYFTEYPSKHLYKTEPKKYKETIVSHYDTITCRKVERDDTIYLIKNKNFLTDTLSIIKTPKEFIEIYHNNLSKLLMVHDFEICPTSDIFDKVLISNSRWKMYRLGDHPSKKASFLFACVFYEMITGQKPKKTKYKIGLSKKSSTKIVKEVDEYLQLIKL